MIQESYMIFDLPCKTFSLVYSKAFDSISHAILCYKLRYLFNFSDSAIEMILSYLSNRTQYVDWDKNISDSLNNKFGVPQGSILGPLLFIMYINDISLTITECGTSIILYAGDTAILIIECFPQKLILKANKELDNINQYCSANLLILNKSKCKVMIFNYKNSSFFKDKILLDGYPLEIVEEYKYLGYIIDCSLKFK